LHGIGPQAAISVDILPQSKDAAIRSNLAQSSVWKNFRNEQAAGQCSDINPRENAS
jgi:hypothetical protein